MKKTLPFILIGASLSLVACATAHADTPSFTGTALAIGLGAARNQVDYGGLLAGTTGKQTDTVGKLDLSHGFNLSPQWLATVGASYDLNKTGFGTVSYLNAGVTQTVQARLKNHFSLYVAPGYRFAPQWLGYVKLGWHTARGEYSDTLAGSGTTSHKGSSFGVGVGTVLSQHLEARFEIQQTSYSRKSVNLSSGKPETREALVYLGYRF